MQPTPPGGASQHSSHAVEVRLDAARRIAPAYAANPRVQCVIAGGSTARGYADRFSDVEIGVFWEQGPSDAERVGAALQAGATGFDADPYNPALEEWIEDYESAGLKIDVVHRSADGD